MTELFCSSPEPPLLTASLLAKLPKSLAYLGIGYNDDILEEFQALPRSITCLGGTIGYWNENIAQAIPSGLLNLELALYDETGPLAPFPPMLTVLNIQGVAIGPTDLRRLPRTLLNLHCTFDLVGLSIETADFPANMKYLSMRPTNDDDPLVEREELNVLAILLPQSMETLRLLNFTPQSQFYGLLPKGLRKIITTAQRCKIDPKQFSLPPRLTSFAIGGVQRRYVDLPPVEALKDMDAWTKQDSICGRRRGSRNSGFRKFQAWCL